MSAVRYLFVKDDKGTVVDCVKLERYQDVDSYPREYSIVDEEKSTQYHISYKLFPNDIGGHSRRMLPGYSTFIGTRKDRDEWIASRPDPVYFDIVGNPVERGSRVAVAFALGRGAEIRVGSVVGYDQLLNGDGGYNVGSRSQEISSREQIVIEWEDSNKRYGGTPEKSKIFAVLRRYVVIQ